MSPRRRASTASANLAFGSIMPMTLWATFRTAGIGIASARILGRSMLWATKMAPFASVSAAFRAAATPCSAPWTTSRMNLPATVSPRCAFATIRAAAFTASETPCVALLAAVSIACAALLATSRHRVDHRGGDVLDGVRDVAEAEAGRHLVAEHESRRLRAFLRSNVLVLRPGKGVGRGRRELDHRAQVPEEGVDLDARVVATALGAHEAEATGREALVLVRLELGVVRVQREERVRRRRVRGLGRVHHHGVAHAAIPPCAARAAWSAALVWGPGIPSTVRPWARWKAVTAALLFGPIAPSTTSGGEAKPSWFSAR